MRIGYLVPEFPGQTHAFFWRELAELRAMGIEADIVSTRRPPTAIVCHEWSAQAQARTTYLFPPAITTIARAAATLIASGPRGWSRSLDAVLSGAGLKHRLRLAGLCFMGAALASLARSSGWSHIHIHSAADAATMGMFASILSGIPYSLTLHGYIVGYGPGQDAKWSNASFGIVVASHLRHDVAREAPGFPPERLDVAPMGVDVARFQRSSPYQPHVQGEPLRIISCGRLDPNKGHADLIAAVADLRARGHPATLTILGEGPARAELETLISARSLGEHVKLPGATSEQGVISLLESSHLFALASHDEAIGVATMEAMSMGLPVIATRVGGVPDLVRDGVDGLLVPPRDPCAIAGAVESLTSGPLRAAAMGRSGAARIRESFSSRVSAAALARRLNHAAPGPVGQPVLSNR